MKTKQMKETMRAGPVQLGERSFCVRLCCICALLEQHSHLEMELELELEMELEMELELEMGLE